MSGEMELNISMLAMRVRAMRLEYGLSCTEMAEKTDISEAEYKLYESGTVDMPFTFIHNCAKVFGMEMTELLEGHSARLSSYAVTRKGMGASTVDEDGIEIKSLAPLLRGRLGEPYMVKYEYSESEQNKPIHTTTHPGQEFDLVLKGKLKVRVGNNIEVLGEGDSIFYYSDTPHGMIAVDGQDCEFLAFVISGEKKADDARFTIAAAKQTETLVCEKFIKTQLNSEGVLQSIDFENDDKFNFAFDIVDEIAEKNPDKRALLWVSRDGEEKEFTYKDIKRASNRCANYFRSLGIKRGDRVMLVLKRHYQFWFSMLALEKIGAVAIPATNQLVAHDYEYRFKSAGISAVIATADGFVSEEIDKAAAECPGVVTKLIVNGQREGWRDFNSEYQVFSSVFDRSEDSPCGDDTMFMLFTSGTSGYPKIAEHTYKYPLGHYITARYWHGVTPDGLHLTISDTGWGKALWGKFFGQWLCEGCVFVYDFDRFDASVIMPMIAKYKITSLCAPPTMLRMMIKQDLTKYDFSSIKNATTAGEALNPEVFRVFKEQTGLVLMEGFGQTETTLTVANLAGTTPKVGSMGKPSPLYDIALLDHDGAPVRRGETGEICINIQKKRPCGLFKGYYKDPEHTAEVVRGGYYHTGDLAWCDEDGYFWYVGRADDVIKSSGYRIGPFEIESVIMELPYVLECGVSAAPDEVRGQIVKASIVLVPGVEGTEELKKEIQNYVKSHTAPYKYPRLVVFRDELPKSTNGKIQRNKL